MKEADMLPGGFMPNSLDAQTQSFLVWFTLWQIQSAHSLVKYNTHKPPCHLNMCVCFFGVHGGQEMISSSHLRGPVKFS